MTWGAFYIHQALGIFDDREFRELKEEAYAGRLLALVERVLEKEKGETELQASHATVAGAPGAREDLLDALRVNIARLRSALAVPHAEVPGPVDGSHLAIPFSMEHGASAKTTGNATFATTCDHRPVETDGILDVDERFASFLEDIGPSGKAFAAKMRERARERWEEQRTHLAELERAGVPSKDLEAAALEARWAGPSKEFARVFEAFDRKKPAPTGDPDTDETNMQAWYFAQKAALHGYRGLIEDDERIEHGLEPLTPEELAEAREATKDIARVPLFFPPLLEAWVRKERGPDVLRYLAIVLWRDVVGPRLEKERKHPAGLARAVSIDVLDLATRRYNVKQTDKQQILEFPENRGWVLVPSIVENAVNDITRRGVELLSSELGIDLLEWEVTKAHSQWAAGEMDFRRIVVEGGYSALAHDHLGRSSKSDADRVRAIIYAQAHMRFETYGVRGNLLAYAEPQKAARGRKSIVSLTLGDMLLYGYAQELREKHGATSLASREARRLVPILGKTALVGRTNDHAAQRRMVWRLAILLRDHAAELAKAGAVRIPLDRWAQLAQEAAMPRSRNVLWRVLDAWKAGDEKAAPLLEQTGKDAYTLHASRKEALDFLVESGKRTLRKTAEGKASAKNRAAPRRKSKR